MGRNSRSKQKKAVKKKNKNLIIDNSLIYCQMHNKYGFILKKIMHFFFKPIRFKKRNSQIIKSASTNGIPIYILKQPNTLEYLLLNHLLLKNNLPLAKFVSGLNLILWQPFISALKWFFSDLFNNEEEPSVQKLFDTTLQKGNSALLFIEPEDKEEKVVVSQFFKTIISIQNKSKKPLLLIPNTVLWGKKPKEHEPSFLARLSGSMTNLGPLRQWLTLWLHFREAIVQVGTPINVKDIIKENSTEDLDFLIRKLQWKLLNFFEKEEKIITGPPLKSAERMKEGVLGDGKLTKKIEEIAASLHKEKDKVKAEARKIINEIASDYRFGHVVIFANFMKLIFNKIYDGVVVDQEGLEIVKEAARKAPVIICPSHKSHVDYLVISWAFYSHDMQLPYIAAGANLSFWPLGPIFRRAGAYFLRRRFKGDLLYTEVLKTYIKHLLTEGFSQEFFIEGTRSRTGKLLSPKTGLLSMEVEAFLEGSIEDILFIPVSVGYEKIIEQKSYVREQLGASKKRENIGALVKTRKVLRSRYGRLYLTFEKPVSLSKFWNEANDNKPKTEDSHRQNIQRLAYKITSGIQEATIVTSTSVVSTVLLTWWKKGVSLTTLINQTEFLVTLLSETHNKNLSKVLTGGVELNRVVEETVVKLRKDGSIKSTSMGKKQIVSVPESRRLALDYYKNNIINFFINYSLIACGLLTADTEKFKVKDIKKSIELLAQIFKFEFVYKSRVETNFNEILTDRLEILNKHNIIELSKDKKQICIPPKGILRFLTLTNIIRPFIESYLLALRTINSLDKTKDMPSKELVKAVQDTAKAELFVGNIKCSEAMFKSHLQGAINYMKKSTPIILISFRNEGIDRIIRSDNPESDIMLKEHIKLLEKILFKMSEFEFKSSHLIHS